MEHIDRVVLIGFSGAGKSTVARLLGARLGWDVLDTDAEAEAAFAAPIAEVFRRHGEAAFRTTELATLTRGLDRDKVVVACGGGAAVDEAVWRPDLLGRGGTLVVALETRSETALARLRAQRDAEGAAVERPLLEGAEPLARIVALKARRQESYDRAHLTLVVDGLAPEGVAAEIADLVVSDDKGDEPALRLTTPGGASAIYVRRGAAARVGELARGRWVGSRRAWSISDETVAGLHAAPLQASLAAAGFETRLLTVPPGERSKSLAEVGRLYDGLLGGGVERGDTVVALGGGVVGDLAGFVAATTLRGIGLVQVPTTLLAMVDSSVGGKTGIDHAAGKNLIGAFYQPPVVAIDPAFLATLPACEVGNGWAEIVKHAVIQASTPGGERADLETFLARNERRLRALEEPATSYLIRRNVALKAAVVAADEREAGIRALLNLGHTLGHAIEAAGYRLLHGEAVAVGMRAAARLGVLVGSCFTSDVERIDAALDRFGLPRRASVDPKRAIELLGSDKKRSAGRQRWVLPLAGGGVELRDNVPASSVREALAAVLEPAAAT